MKTRKELSFDGFGINGPDEFRTRIATFSTEFIREHREEAEHYGKLFENAPDMLVLLMECHSAIDPYEDGILKDDIARLIQEIRK